MTESDGDNRKEDFQRELGGIKRRLAETEGPRRARFANFDEDFERTQREIEATRSEIRTFGEEFDRQWEADQAAWEAEEAAWEADQAAWEEMDRAMDGIAAEFFRAIISGNDDDLADLEVRTVAQFERFLDWHEESSKLWRNGYISDELQAEISSQFSAEAMATWRINLDEDVATPEQIAALQERMLEVNEHAQFLSGHIAGKSAATPPTPGAKPPALA